MKLSSQQSYLRLLASGRSTLFDSHHSSLTVVHFYRVLPSRRQNSWFSNIEFNPFWSFLFFRYGKGPRYQHVESLICDQTFQVPDVEDSGGRPGVFVGHEHGFQDKVCKTRGLPKDKPDNSMPASEKSETFNLTNNSNYKSVCLHRKNLTP